MHELVMGIWAWLQANPLAGGGIAVALALMLWRRPGQTLKLLAGILVLVALGYLVAGIIDFTMESATVKEQGIERSQ